MKTLPELVAEFSTDISPADIVANLNSKTEKITNTDRVNLSKLEEIIGHADLGKAIGIISTLASNDPYLSLQVQSLAISGWNFADGRIQGFVDKLVSGGAMTPELGKKIKEIGVKAASPAEVNGLPVVTLESVIAIRSENLKTSLKAIASGKYNECVTRIDSGELTDEESILAFLGA